MIPKHKEAVEALLALYPNDPQPKVGAIAAGIVACGVLFGRIAAEKTNSPIIMQEKMLDTCESFVAAAMNEFKIRLAEKMMKEMGLAPHEPN